MKTQFKALLTITLLSSCISEDHPKSSSMSSQLIGDWIAGETMMPHPSKDMWQDIKSISFHANGIVLWSEVKQGTVVDQIGRYEVYLDPESKRKLPTLFIAPTNYPTPTMSSICLLRLSELEIDIDSRFHPEKVGMVLKAKTTEGTHVVFVRIKRELTD
jgi:hypothetical protein